MFLLCLYGKAKFKIIIFHFRTSILDDQLNSNTSLKQMLIIITNMGYKLKTCSPEIINYKFKNNLSNVLVVYKFCQWRINNVNSKKPKLKLFYQNIK